MQKKILIVDDEKDLVDLLAYNLEKAGFKASRAYDGEAGLRKAEQDRPDALILDLMLPGMDGLEVCRRLRATEHGPSLPILMLTAKAGEHDKVLGLEIGADDYMTKPFSPKELVARLKALLRRRAPAQSPQKLDFGDLVVDPDRHEALVGRAPGREVELTAREFQLLYYLASRPGRVLTREVLLDEIWNMDSDVETRTVDVHMRRLRQKLGPAARHLKTLRGVGYKFSDR